MVRYMNMKWPCGSGASASIGVSATLETLTAVLAGADDGTVSTYKEAEQQWRKRGRGKVNTDASSPACLTMIPEK